MKNHHNYITKHGFENIARAAWEKLMETSITPSVFQSPAMYRFFDGLKGFSPFVFSISNSSGKILALLSGVIQKEGRGIKGEMTKRAIIFGGPLLSDSGETHAALKILLSEVNNYLSKRAIYAETRNLNDFGNFKKAFKETGWNYTPHLNFQVDCSSKDTVMKRISKSKMRQIRKSIKAGAEIIDSTNINEIKDFYNILVNLYKTKVKTPLPQFDFFKNFNEIGLGKYLLIKYNEKIVGGIMCPILPGKVIYEWYVCGMDGTIKNVYPSIMATWAAIDFAVKNNISRFDFMGAGTPDKDYGVREFKSKFGGELVEHGRFKIIYNQTFFKMGLLGYKMMKRL